MPATAATVASAMNALNDRPRFAVKISGLSSDVRVAEMDVQERISDLYEANLLLACKEPIAFDDVIGKDALLTIAGSHADRLLQGIINRFAEVGKRGSFHMYQARIVPQLWLLSQNRDSWIFQEKTVKDIVTDILQTNQVPADRFAFRLKESYKLREYCVQYQESDLHFISRLLEEEGIWYFFEPARDKHLVAFADASTAYKKIPGAPSIEFNQSAGMAPTDEAVFQFSCERRIGPGKVTQTDYSYVKPSLKLNAEEKGDKHHALEIYEHPGRYEDPHDGARLTKVRLQEHTAMQEVAQGDSNAPMLSPGYTFSMKNHENGAFNREYLICSVTHKGAQPQVLEDAAGTGGLTYSNHFVAVPSTVDFRPERDTPKPHIPGPQTAVVVGPKGEEIYTDEHGRIKARFHWDRGDDNKDEKSSCWMRVAQLWAGEGWGSTFLPRIGQEVVVSFIDGDPDRPLITGRVYNGANTAPHGLPANKTKSTIVTSSVGGKGSNELSFEDKSGGEQVVMKAQKDMNVNTNNNKSESVGNDETHSVAKNRTRSVGADEKISVKANRAKDIGGKEDVSVGGTRTHTVTGHEKLVAKAGRTKNVTGDETVTISQNHSETVSGGKTEAVTGARTETVGAAKSETVGSTSHELVKAAKTVNVGAAYEVGVVGAHSVNVGGAMNVLVVGAHAEQVGAVKSVLVKGSYSTIVKSDHSVTATGGITNKAAKKIVLNAGDSLELVCGKSSITITDKGVAIKSDTLTFDGKKMGVEASGDVKIKGNKTDIN